MVMLFIVEFLYNQVNDLTLYPQVLSAYSIYK